MSGSDISDRDQILMRVSESVARIEGKLDARVRVVDDHEVRIRKLEKHKWYQVGGAGALGAAAAFMAKLGIFPS